MQLSPSAAPRCWPVPLWSMVDGLWFMVYSLWFSPSAAVGLLACAIMVYGLGGYGSWCMVYGVWFMVYGLWFNVYG